jgi:hypothetical protein
MSVKELMIRTWFPLREDRSAAKRNSMLDFLEAHFPKTFCFTPGAVATKTEQRARCARSLRRRLEMKPHKNYLMAGSGVAVLLVSFVLGVPRATAGSDIKSIDPAKPGIVVQKSAETCVDHARRLATLLDATLALGSPDERLQFRQGAAALGVAPECSIRAPVSTSSTSQSALVDQ